MVGALNEYGPLRRVAVCSPAVAFGDEARIAREWRALGFTAPPDLARARAEHDAFAALLTRAGAAIEELPPAPGLTLDGLYVRDASIVTPHGVVLARMGKAARRAEPAAHRVAFDALGVPVAGAIAPPGHLEGGDIVWIDERTVLAGRGYRTDDDGIRQLRARLPAGTELIVVPLPHHRGPDDVFHLMSILSPVDRDLAVVFSPLMPVVLREWLIARGVALVEVPPEEFDSLGCNVFAVAPRCCVMVDGNPVTRARLEAAGAEVWVYPGVEISLKGGGGPTCLTRPLVRG